MVLPDFKCVSSSLWREPRTASALLYNSWHRGSFKINSGLYACGAHTCTHTHTSVHASGAAAVGRLEMMYPSQMPLTVIPIKKRARRGSDGNRHGRERD